MKPMQGNSMGKLCFSTFVLENKRYLFFFFTGFSCCFSIHAHGMCLCRDDRAYSWFTSSNTSCFKKKIKKNWATGEQGYKAARWGKETKRERAHREAAQSRDAFLSLFFSRQSGWVCVQISKKTNKTTMADCYGDSPSTKCLWADAAFAIVRVVLIIAVLLRRK